MLCSRASNTPQCRNAFPHRMFTDDELIKKKVIFNPIEDDDDIDWKHNPFAIAAVDPMKIVIDEDKWRLPCNRAPPRKHSQEKQKEIRKQVDVLLESSRCTQGVASHAMDLVPKWRFTLVFIRLNSATGGLEG